MISSTFEWTLLSKKQLTSIHGANHRANMWHGAVRSGKTIGSIVRWLKHIEEMKYAKGHFLMTGVTIGTLKDNILDPIEAMVGPENYRYSAGSRDVHICGIRVLIRGAADESAEKKIRGLTLKGHYGDECTLWPTNYYKRGMDRLSVKGAKFFGTTNPDSPYHWLKTDFIDRGINGTGETDLLDFHFELEDNNSLEEEYIDNLKKEFSGLWYKRFILGLWVVAEGAIYNMFNEDEHVVDELPASLDSLADFEKVIDGVDYGTSNPTAFIALGLHKGTWYAFAESRYHNPERSRTDEEHSTALQEFITRGGVLPPTSIEVDPSAASFKTQLKRDGVRRVKEADNEVLDGIRVVAAGLTSGKLKIHSSCKELIKEFMTYVWDPKAQEERGEDKPIKLYDHCFVAGTPILTEDGDKPIEQIPPGTQVWTRDGLKPVMLTWRIPNQPIFKLTLSDGRELRATATHPVWVEGKGFTKMTSLRYGDIIKENTPRHARAPVSVLSVLEEHISEDVYDLTVLDAHEYYANRILVHNSLDALRYAARRAIGRSRKDVLSKPKGY